MGRHSVRRLHQRLYDIRLVPAAAWALLVIALTFPVRLSDDRPPPLSAPAHTAVIVGDRAFSLVDWELQILGQRLREVVQGRPAVSAADTGAVHRYFSAVANVNRLLGEERALVAAGHPADDVRLEAARHELAAAREERRSLEPAARAVLELQVTEAIRDLHLGDAFLEFENQDAFPLFSVRVTPAVFFSFANLPLALTVGPRDRIAVSHSQLLQPAIPPADRTAIEDSLDGALNVASIILPIGGFAAYPSMIPASAALPESLNTIAHEWVHHYLTVRPLGWNYLTSYEMRSINETVADIIGEEISARVWQTYYVTDQADAAERATPRTDPFTAEMRRIRQETERLLATGDLDAVARYLEAERVKLVAQGYAVRKLNTTYLAFFGSYSGAGNVWEAGLRNLRESSRSLAEFAGLVSSASSPEDVRRLLEASPSSG